MPKPTRSFAQIEQDVKSPDPAVRGSAIQELLLRVKNDPALQALAIFRHAVDVDQDPAVVTTAARGVQDILSPEESRSTWLDLLNRPDAMMVARAALAIDDRQLVPTLLDLLRRRPEPVVHHSILYTLGRLKDPAAYDTLIACLENPNLRSHAIDALADFGDPRAIPHLQPFVNDKTDARPDDRGWMMQIGDLASDAIRQLQRARA
jgi:HEAT repeat protein